MRAAEPGLNVDSVARAIEWYGRVAGFTTRFVIPGVDPPYALIEREGDGPALAQAARGSWQLFLLSDCG